MKWELQLVALYCTLSDNHSTIESPTQRKVIIPSQIYKRGVYHGISMKNHEAEIWVESDL